MNPGAEDRHVGMERQPRPIELTPTSDECPAHPGEPLYDCEVCAR